jgi:hypothetical protein
MIIMSNPLKIILSIGTIAFLYWLIKFFDFRNLSDIPILEYTLNDLSGILVTLMLCYSAYELIKGIWLED